jgi:hypothetical protein
MMRAPAIALVVGALLLSAAPAGGHHAAARTEVPVLDPLDHRLSGVTVQLRRTLADQLVVENRTGRVLEVLDETGTPFIRLGPVGAEADLGAAAWYRTASTLDAPLPAGVGASGSRWTRVAAEPAWGWYDRRLRARGNADAGRSLATPERWTVPLRLDGVPIALTGRFEPVRSGAFVARVTSSAAPFPGVRVSLIPGRVPALYVENKGRRPVVVLGARGEPFLRIGPGGTSANLRSPAWLASGKAEVTPAASPAGTTGAPLWRRVSTVPRFAWIELRAAHDRDAPPWTAPTVVGRWRVPLERGRARAEIAGVVEWIPASLPGLRAQGEIGAHSR